MRRPSVLALASAAVILIATFLMPGAAAQVPGGPDYDIPSGHFFTQANGGAGANFGYRITDEGGIGFWSEFQRLGGVTALGYPASRRFSMDGFTVQATQKYILQWRPEVGQAFFVNVFDKLHDQGKDNALQSQYGIPTPVDPSIDQATRLGYLAADADIANQYGSGPAAIQANGLPTSTIVNAGPFKIIRNQRDAIQKWNIAGPGGITPGTVSVVNGGDVAKALGLVPADAQITETASGQPAATPTPMATATPVAPQFTYMSKGVTDPPVDCNNDITRSAIPCAQVVGNGNQQFIKGRVMDKNGSHLLFVPVHAQVTGGATLTQDVQTQGDGTFTFWIGGAPPGQVAASGSNCPTFSLQYQIWVSSTTGARDSDIRTINYDGNCGSDGEFHFDFVKVK